MFRRLVRKGLVILNVLALLGLLATSPLVAQTPLPGLPSNPNDLLRQVIAREVKSVEGDLWDQTEVTARFKFHGIQNNFAVFARRRVFCRRAS